MAPSVPSASDGDRIYLRRARPFFNGRPVGRRNDAATGEVAGTYPLTNTDANVIMRVHDRMAVILATNAARQ